MKHNHKSRTFGKIKIDQVPRWLRPKMKKITRTELGLTHYTNIDIMCKGEGTPELMWQIGGGILTFAFIARELRKGETDMLEQSELLRRLVAHYQATGRVEWPSDADYRLGVHGVEVMDLLAELVDHATALAAAEYSETRINEIRDRIEGTTTESSKGEAYV